MAQVYRSIKLKPYLVVMRYRAEAFLWNTDDLAADLGRWESNQVAQAACLGHSRELLTWDQPWSGIWQARTNAHWYQIVASPD